MPTRPNLPKTRKKPKSSNAARKLIRSAYRHHKSIRGAARAIGLDNPMQLIRMMEGTMKDTPAMRAAIRRADHRARLAWSFKHEENHKGHVDAEVVAQLWREFKSITRRFESLMKECDNTEAVARTESHSETD